MAYKYVQLSLLWTVDHISKLIAQRFKSRIQSKKWLIKSSSVPFNEICGIRYQRPLNLFNYQMDT